MNSVVTLHGFGVDSRIWSPVGLAFDGYRVIHLSLPGFGDAPFLKDYSIRELAAVCWGRLDESGVTRAHLVGHSMGGYVALAMAATRPGSVQSLSLVHSHGFADSEEKKRERSLTIEGVVRYGRSFVVEKLIPSLFASPGHHSRAVNLLRRRAYMVADEAWIAGAAAMRDREDLQGVLHTILCPVQMIVGLKDSAVDPSLVFAQAAFPEKVVLRVYPEAGHLAMYENTAGMIEDLAGFLAYADS